MHTHPFTQVTKRSAAGLLAGAFTAIVPSYISRSVGGSYDNEGVAIFALIFCFYLWIKAVHTGMYVCMGSVMYGVFVLHRVYGYGVLVCCMYSEYFYGTYE